MIDWLSYLRHFPSRHIGSLSRHRDISGGFACEPQHALLHANDVSRFSHRGQKCATISKFYFHHKFRRSQPLNGALRPLQIPPCIILHSLSPATDPGPGYRCRAQNTGTDIPNEEILFVRLKFTNDALYPTVCAI